MTAGANVAEAYIDGYHAALRGVLVMAATLAEARESSTPELAAIKLYCERCLELLPTARP